MNTDITGSPSVTSSSSLTRADAAMFSSTKLLAPKARAVVTLSHLLASPTTTTCASGKLAFVALRASTRLLPSRSPIRTNTCSPASDMALGTPALLEAVHAGSNGLFAKIFDRPSRKIRFGCTTTLTTDGIGIYSKRYRVALRTWHAAHIDHVNPHFACTGAPFNVMGAPFLVLPICPAL